MNEGIIFFIGFVVVCGGFVGFFFYTKNQTMKDLAIERFPLLIKECNLDGVNNLLKYKAIRNDISNVYYTHKDGRFTYLQLAVKYGNMEILKAFIDSGADVHVPKTVPSALETAIYINRQDMTNLLLETKINPEMSEYVSLLLMASVKAENREIINRLLQQGANINAVKSGESALHSAVASQKHDMLKFLIEKGAKTDLPGYLSIPLIDATKKDDNKAVLLLLQAGANVNALDATHKTALYYATLNGKSEIEQLLVKYGADLSFKTVRLFDLDDYYIHQELIKKSSDDEEEMQRKLEQLKEEAINRNIIKKIIKPVYQNPLLCNCGTVIGWFDKYGVHHVNSALCNQKLDENFDAIYTCPGCGKFVSSCNLM